jgi:hypothetical protein
MINNNDYNGSRNIEANENKLPTFPDTLFLQLPQFLQDAVKYATSNQERDMLLLGTITSISSCIPKIYGIYDGDKVYSNIYLYVTAPPSSGKGKLNLCKKIISPIHKLLREETNLSRVNYKKELGMFDKGKIEDKNLVKPKNPVEKMLFIPANNSSTGMFQLLSDNDGRGMIFETEGDTVTLALKSDYGNYSDGFRKAFHHETISYYRRTDKEYVEIDNPCLSVILSGTPGQVVSLIPNAENGLFSRFIFYYLDLESAWIDVFAHSSSNALDVHYNNLGAQFLEFYNLLNVDVEINISLSESQQKSFKNLFSKIQTKYLNIKSDEYIATIRRLGLIAFRFAMVFTALRIMEDGDISKERECSDIDFENAIMMIPILIQHSRKVFSTLPKDAKPSGFKSSKEEFIEALPKSFCREDYLNIAEKFGVTPKTAERYIAKLVKDNILNKKSHNNYINTLIQDDVESKEIEDSKDIFPTSSILSKSLDPQ